MVNLLFIENENEYSTLVLLNKIVKGGRLCVY